MPLLLKAGIVNDQSRPGSSAQQIVGMKGDLIHQGAMLPRRVADGVMHVLAGKSGHAFLHALHVLTPPFCLHQPGKIRTNFLRVRIAASGKKPRVGFYEFHKTSRRPRYKL